MFYHVATRNWNLEERICFGIFKIKENTNDSPHYLTLNYQPKLEAKDILFFFFREISLDISRESIHIKCQDFFSLKEKNISKCRPLKL